MLLEHRLSALLQLHLHSRRNTRFQWIGQNKCDTRQEIFKVKDLVTLETWLHVNGHLTVLLYNNLYAAQEIYKNIPIAKINPISQIACHMQ